MVHDKFHGSNHHTRTSDVYNQPDSGLDCIASQQSPFHGDFVLSGAFVTTLDKTDNIAGTIISDGVTVLLSSENYSFDACGAVLCDDISIDSLTITNAIISIDKQYTRASTKLLHTNKDNTTCMRLWSLDVNSVSAFLPPRFTIQPSLCSNYFDNPINFSATLSCDAISYNGSEIAYQWYINNVPAPGETSKTLTIQTKEHYYVVATSNIGSTRSRAVSLISPIVASNDYINAKANTPTVFTVLSNDTGNSVLPLRVVDYTNPQNGLLDFDAVLNQFTYTPFKSYSGNDAFTYIVADDLFQTSTATVFLTCDITMYICVDDIVNIVQNDIAVFEIGTSNIPGTLVWELFDYTQPKYGLITIDRNTMIVTYRPSTIKPANTTTLFYDTFTYTIRDSANNKTIGTVNLKV